MITTLRALKALSREQRAILEKQRVDGDYTPRWLLDTLNALGEFDRLSDKARARLGVWIGLCVVATILSLIAAVNGLVVPGVVPLIAVPALVYFAVTLRKLSKLDLSNNFRVVALPFFAILNQDMAAEEKLGVKLDLSSATTKSKQVRSIPPYKAGAYYKVVDTHFRDPWFSGHARLADGTALSWEVSDEIVTRSRTKRTSRGKIKTKSGARKVSTIAVAVGLPADTYAIGTGPIPEGDKFKLVEGDKRNTIKLGRKIKAKSLEPMAARELIDIVGEAYMRAKPAGAAP